MRVGWRVVQAPNSSACEPGNGDGDSPFAGRSGQAAPDARNLLRVCTIAQSCLPRAPDKLRSPGAVAQSVEHLLCKQEVVGSIPIRSTRKSLVGGLQLEDPKQGWQFQHPIDSESGLCEEVVELFLLSFAT